MSGFSVLKPGFLTLITDLGRFGYHRIGVTSGGPVDASAFRWANRLLGNPANAVMLEVSIGGLVLEAQLETRIAVTGAETRLTVNGESKPLWCCHRVRNGDRIELGFARDGCRSYFAVAGGLLVAPTFGSATTVLRESLGGLNGEKLTAGDQLHCAAATDGPLLMLPESERPDYSAELALRVIPVCRHGTFSRAQKRRFFSAEYTVTDRCDRMGYRLNGATIEPAVDGILSEGVCLGTIQVPADGQPIVLMNDRQTIGGYPKIGAVLSLDVASLGQRMAGARVSFRPITPAAARDALLSAERRFRQTELVRLS